MGFYEQKVCVFTNYEAQPIINDVDAIEYFVMVNNKRHLIRLPYNANQWSIDDEFFIKNKNIFFALLYNDDWFEDENRFIELEDLESLLERKIIPKEPEEKLENLFVKLFSVQEEDGKWINVDSELYNNILWKILYFKSFDELNYYFEVLIARNLIEPQFYRDLANGKLLNKYRITFEGLNYAVKLREEGEKSNKCFVAMSFKPDTNGIRFAIKEAIQETGFVPILIDEQNVDSDKTINDEIIANLKRCKFCISDFTFHSMGVYFESGFALGQGKKVIYTCREDEFQKAHFDLRPLQHIIYENEDQLKKDLINKIEAWIK
jgi:hypothetical protein